MKPILIDCDPGIDDAVAILLALKSPAVDLRAITCVSGNLTADICQANALKILDLGDADVIPVARGPLKPLVRPYPRDPFSHGADGLAELDLKPSTRTVDERFAPDLILDLSHEFAGDLTIVAQGPLTNLALALIKDPSLPSRIKELICLAGAFGFGTAGATRATGDNPASEWNVYVDPEAAKLVFAGGFNLTAVGLDVGAHPKMALKATHRKRLQASKTPSADFLLGVTAFVERRGFDSYCGLIDSLAVATAIDPTILTLEPVSVAVEVVSQLSLGQTIVDRRKHFKWGDLSVINAASDFDDDRFFEVLIAALTDGQGEG